MKAAALVTVLLCAACAVTEPARARVAAPEEPSACPPSYGAGGGCRGDTRCTYAEGECACGPALNCHGGALTPPPDAPGTPPKPATPSAREWRCTPAAAPGCPSGFPAGLTCTREKQVCPYQSGCSGFDAVCSGGQWQFRPWPPPP